MKITGWIAAFILFLVVLYFQLCNNKNTTAIGGDVYDAMVKAKTDSIKYYRSIIKADSVDINEANMATAEEREKAELFRRSFMASQNQVQRLSNKIEAAKREAQDDTWVAVSPRYVEGCDSLRIVAIDQSGKINDAQEVNARLVLAMDREIRLRDTAILHRDQFNAAIIKQLDSCHLRIKATVKPQRAQVYAGVGMLGNTINPIAGGQVNISLKTRGNKIYEVTGAAVGGSWYMGLGTKFLISFRR